MPFSHLAKSRTAYKEILSLFQTAVKNGIGQVTISGHHFDFQEIVEDLKKGALTSDPLAQARARLFGEESSSGESSSGESSSGDSVSDMQENSRNQAKLIWQESSNALLKSLDDKNAFGHWALQFRGTLYPVEGLLQYIAQRLQRDED